MEYGEDDEDDDDDEETTGEPLKTNSNLPIAAKPFSAVWS